MHLNHAGCKIMIMVCCSASIVWPSLGSYSNLVDSVPEEAADNENASLNSTFEINPAPSMAQGVRSIEDAKSTAKFVKGPDYEAQDVSIMFTALHPAISEEYHPPFLDDSVESSEYVNFMIASRSTFVYSILSVDYDLGVLSVDSTFPQNSVVSPAATVSAQSSLWSHQSFATVHATENYSLFSMESPRKSSIFVNFSSNADSSVSSDLWFSVYKSFDVQDGTASVKNLLDQRVLNLLTSASSGFATETSAFDRIPLQSELSYDSSKSSDIPLIRSTFLDGLVLDVSAEDSSVSYMPQLKTGALPCISTASGLVLNSTNSAMVLRLHAEPDSTSILKDQDLLLSDTTSSSIETRMGSSFLPSRGRLDSTSTVLVNASAPVLGQIGVVSVPLELTASIILTGQTDLLMPSFHSSTTAVKPCWHCSAAVSPSSYLNLMSISSKITYTSTNKGFPSILESHKSLIFAGPVDSIWSVPSPVGKILPSVEPSIGGSDWYRSGQTFSVTLGSESNESFMPRASGITYSFIPHDFQFTKYRMLSGSSMVVVSPRTTSTYDVDDSSAFLSELTWWKETAFLSDVASSAHISLDSSAKSGHLVRSGVSNSTESDFVSLPATSNLPSASYFLDCAGSKACSTVSSDAAVQSRKTTLHVTPSLLHRATTRLDATMGYLDTLHVSKRAVSESPLFPFRSVKVLSSSSLLDNLDVFSLSTANMRTLGESSLASVLTTLTPSSDKPKLPSASMKTTSFPIDELFSSVLERSKTTLTVRLAFPFTALKLNSLDVIVQKIKPSGPYDVREPTTWFSAHAQPDFEFRRYRALEIASEKLAQLSGLYTKVGPLARFARDVADRFPTFDVVIGSEQGCLVLNKTYCNGPLIASSHYRFQIEGIVADGSVVRSLFTKAHSTSPEGAGEEVGGDGGPSAAILILLTVLFVCVLIVVLVVTVIVLRRKHRGRAACVRRDELNCALLTPCRDGVLKSPIRRHAFSGPDIAMRQRLNIKGMSRPVHVKDFAAWVARSQSDSDFRFAEEFESMRDVGKDERREVADMPENRGKNRYVNILPYDHSRVKLSYVDDELGSDYINANYIHGYKRPRAYIATQGPLPSTTDDFWRMVWEQNSRIIVMITQCMERSRVKCHEYWPSVEPTAYGDITVSRLAEYTCHEYVEREFLLECEGETRQVRHFQYIAWPDHGVPRTTDEILDFVQNIKTFQLPRDGPLICHCSAGVGRTGTYLCIDMLINQLQEENTVDVYGAVCLMRTQRCAMVQTEDQYIFIHQCINDYLRTREDHQTLFKGYSLIFPQRDQDDQATCSSGLLADQSTEEAVEAMSDDSLVRKSYSVIGEPGATVALHLTEQSQHETPT